MKKLIKLVLALTVVIGVSACGLTKEKMGMTQKAPNEFMVAPRPPLSLPPEYDLRPVVVPQPNADSSNADLSAAEQKLLSKINS